MLIKRLIPVLAATLVMAGCAISPQQIAVEPGTDESFPSAASSGITVSVETNDTRESSELGSLGGTYDETSALTATNDIAADLGAVISDKLTEAGYDVVDGDAQFRMVITLTELSYVREPGTLSSEVRVVADMDMRIEDDNGFLERSYRSGSNQTRITRPSEANNKMFLEEALNDSLSRLVRDQRLHTFLSR